MKPNARYSSRLTVEEYLVDLLGGLVPGVLFLVGAGFAIVPSVRSLYLSLQGTARTQILEPPTTVLTSIQQISSTIWIGIFIVGLILAYVVGHLFYRSDPKVPDEKSWSRLCGGIKDLKEQREELACDKASGCQFPYLHLAAYLKHRGFRHLTPFVIWAPNTDNIDESAKTKGADGLDDNDATDDVSAPDDEYTPQRTKNYINVLKIRLRYHAPDKCGVIIRNEAHVRLAASTWYVARSLFYICAVGALITGAGAGITFAQLDATQPSAWTNTWSDYFAAVSSLLMVLAVSVFAYHSVLRFLHYQRLREVFFVLETAYTVFWGKFELLEPPFTASKLRDAGSKGQQTAQHVV